MLFSFDFATIRCWH